MYRHIACIPTGDHRGDKRFPDNDAPPRLRGWRCDLTALSRRYNLYFLASVDVVHVHQPSFPDQNLSSEAELVLHPPKSGIIGQGIDPSNPHSITRILVDYLGNEEILLLACDDGDVVGYRTQEIHRILERRINLQEPANDDGIHVFLHQNVGASAWGLAVHREARIIAISANTHRITIIAYALASNSKLELLDRDTHESSSPVPNFPYNRQKDNIFTLLATNNIPALSFFGNSGRWLLSSCIDGKTSLWDLTTREEVATFQLGWCASASDLSTPPRYSRHRFLCDCPAAQNVLHGAWGTIVLDTQSAYELSEEEKSTSCPFTADFLDVTNQKECFRVSNRTSPCSEPSESDYDSNVTDDEQPAQPFAQLIQAVSEHAYMKKPVLSELDPILKVYPKGIRRRFSASIARRDLANAPTMADELHNGDTTQPIIQHESHLHMLDQLEMLYTTHPVIKRPYRVVKNPYQVEQPSGTDINAPFMIFTKEDVFLVQGSCKTSLNYTLDQVTAMRRPLHPGQWVEALTSQDRHCFFSQIPELGVFIAGSPIGRVGVFSLYYTKDEDHEQPRYGFKLEYLLPFHRANQTTIAGVPHGRLLGIAAAPIQGMFDISKDAEVLEHEEEMPQPRRWRLLMYYTDHTVLSFELSKRRVDESLSLGDMVV